MGEVGEGGEFEQGLSEGWGVDDFVFEYPGEVVGEEDGVEAGGEGGVDVRAGRVADHPGVDGVAGVVGEEGSVGLGVLFGEDFDGGEERAEARALQLVDLLVEIALGDEEDAVAGAEVFERSGDAGEEFDLGGGDGFGEGDDAGVFFRGDGGVGELLEAVDQRAAKALQAVAELGDGGALAEVEVLADLFVGVNAVVEVGDEGGDGLLEVDVVLPQGIVCVEEQGLVGKAVDGLGHREIIEAYAMLDRGEKCCIQRGLICCGTPVEAFGARWSLRWHC